MLSGIRRKRSSVLVGVGGADVGGVGGGGGRGGGVGRREERGERGRERERERERSGGMASSGRRLSALVGFGVERGFAVGDRAAAERERELVRSPIQQSAGTSGISSGHDSKLTTAQSGRTNNTPARHLSLSSFPPPNIPSPDPRPPPAPSMSSPPSQPHLLSMPHKDSLPPQLLTSTLLFPPSAASAVSNSNTNGPSPNANPHPNPVLNSNSHSHHHSSRPTHNPSSAQLPSASQQQQVSQPASRPAYFVPVSSPNPYARATSRPAPPQPSDPDAALIAAVESRSIVRVRDALTRGAKPQARKWVKFSCRVFRDWERRDGRVVTKDLGELRHDVALGESALALAIMVGQADVVEALLDAGPTDLVHDPVEWTLWSYHLPWTHDDWTRKRVACTFTFNSALSFALGAGRVTSADGLPLLEWQRDLEHGHTLRVNKKGGVVRLVDPQWSSERCDEVTVRASAEVIKVLVKRGGLVTERVADAARRLARRDILQALGMNPALAPSSASASGVPPPGATSLASAGHTGLTPASTTTSAPHHQHVSSSGASLASVSASPDPRAHRPSSLVSLPVPPPSARPPSQSDASIAHTMGTALGAGSITGTIGLPPTPGGSFTAGVGISSLSPPHVGRPPSAATAPAGVGGLGGGMWRDLTFRDRERDQAPSRPSAPSVASMSMASVGGGPAVASIAASSSLAGTSVSLAWREMDPGPAPTPTPSSSAQSGFVGVSSNTGVTGLSALSGISGVSSQLTSQSASTASPPRPAQYQSIPANPYVRARTDRIASAPVVGPRSDKDKDRTSSDPPRGFRQSPPPSPALSAPAVAPAAGPTPTFGPRATPPPLADKPAHKSRSSVSLSLASLAAALAYSGTPTGVGGLAPPRPSTASGVSVGLSTPTTPTTASLKPVDDLLRSNADLELRLATLDATHRKKLVQVERKLAETERDRDEWMRRAEAAVRETEGVRREVDAAKREAEVTRRELEGLREREARLTARLAELEGRGGSGGGRSVRRAGSARGQREGSPLGLGSVHGGGVPGSASVDNGRRSPSSVGTGGAEKKVWVGNNGIVLPFEVVKEVGLKRPGTADSGVGVVW